MGGSRGWASVRRFAGRPASLFAPLVEVMIIGTRIRVIIRVVILRFVVAIVVIIVAVLLVGTAVAAAVIERCGQ